MLQQELFPRLQSVAGPLSGQLKLLAAVISLAPLERVLCPRRASTGRPAKDRAALATAFVAKAVMNFPTTRDLISRLHVDEALRQFCGWSSVQSLTRYLPARLHFNGKSQLRLPPVPRHSAKQNPLKTAPDSAV